MLRTMDDLARTVNDILAQDGDPVDSILIHKDDVAAFAFGSVLHGDGNIVMHFAVDVFMWNGSEELKEQFGGLEPKPGVIVVKYNHYSFMGIQ